MNLQLVSRIPLTRIFRCVDGLNNNSGQICFAASRVYVQEGIYDKFLQEYIAAFKAKTKLIGDPEDKATQIGPVVDKSQYDRIMGIIESARDQGDGELIVGGRQKGETVSIIPIMGSLAI